MNGFAFIIETFEIKQATIAEMLKVSRVSVNNWLHGKKPIPEERAKQLSALTIFKGIKHEYFMKESLSPSEQMDIQILKMHHDSEAIEIEDSHIDENGIEHKYKTIHYTHENELRFLTNERDRIKEAERLIKDINFLLINDDDMEENPEFKLSFKEGTNLSTLENVVDTLQSDNKQHQIALKILLELFKYDSGKLWGDPYFRIVGKRQKEFAKELVALLKKFGILNNDF